MADEKWAKGHPDADAATLEGSQAEHVAHLARTVTKMSIQSGHPDTHTNPFTGTTEESLNPLSGKFDYKKWIHSILAITSRDPERYPTRTAGISFVNLNVHGYGSAADHQKTVGNVLLDIPSLIAGLFGRKGKRVDILRDFEGVVKQGEMLVVLGPPGSGCTTLLKTISGETHGFYVGDEAKLNYQGIPWETMHKDHQENPNCQNMAKYDKLCHILTDR